MTDTKAFPNLSEDILENLAQQSWALSDDFVPPDLCAELEKDLDRLQAEGLLKKAAIGRGQDQQVRADIRGDFTAWLDESTQIPAQKDFFNFMQGVQSSLNQNFFLNLQELEAHYALYPPGSGYAKHVDQHAGTRFRKITFILYLNRNWQSSMGGELVLYKPDESSQVLAKVEPLFGRLILFRSEVFPHQVADCLSPRKSLTGWFRTSH